MTVREIRIVDPSLQRHCVQSWFVTSAGVALYTRCSGRRPLAWTDQDGAQVVGELTTPRASFTDQPNGVQRLFDLIDQGIGGVKKPCDPNHSQHTDLQIVDKADDGGRDFLTLRAERFERLGQNRLNLLVHPKRLED